MLSFFSKEFSKELSFSSWYNEEDKYYPLVMIEWIHNFIQLKISWKWLEPVCISYFNVFICVFYLLFKRKQFKMKILQLGGKLLVLCEVLCWLTPWLNFIMWIKKKNRKTKNKKQWYHSISTEVLIRTLQNLF